MNDRIAKLEVKRVRLHDYILSKLDDRDYHGIADAAMDLRELEVEVKLIEEQRKTAENEAGQQKYKTEQTQNAGLER